MNHSNKRDDDDDNDYDNNTHSSTVSLILYCVYIKESSSEMNS